jgi:hypothetical protein
MTAQDRVLVRVDASVFNKWIGAMVAKGEILDTLEDSPIPAPFNARVDGVSFNAEDHRLVVSLVQKEDAAPTAFAGRSSGPHE